MDRAAYPTRKRHLTDPEDYASVEGLDAAARVAMVWQLTLNAWAFVPGAADASRLSRHVVRVARGGQ